MRLKAAYHVRVKARTDFEDKIERMLNVLFGKIDRTDIGEKDKNSGTTDSGINSESEEMRSRRVN